MEERKAWLKLAAWIGILIALGVARHFLFPDTGPEDARQVIEKTGPWAHVVLLGAFVAFGAVFFPLGWLMVVSGAAFGLPWGLLWSYGGVVGASLLGYFLARLVKGRFCHWLQDRVPDLFKRMDDDRWTLTTLRAVPFISESLFNAAAGIQKVPATRFALAVAIGAVPGVVAYTLLGTVIGGLRFDEPSTWPWTLGLVVAGVTAFVGIGAWAMHRARQLG